MKKIIFAVLFGLALLAVFISPFLIKIKIQCQSQFGDCPTDINSSLSALNSESLFDARRGSKKILSANKLITDFSEQYKLPNILLINILVRKPAFALYNKNSSETWLLDSDGTVLVKTGTSLLPKVIISQNVPPPGQKVDNATYNALKITGGVWNMYQTVLGEETSDGLTVDLPSSLTVIFPLDKDSEVLLGALRLIYTKLTTGDLMGRYKQIDLRFKNPVLR